MSRGVESKHVDDRYGAFFHHAPLAYYVFDGDGFVRELNEAGGLLLRTDVRDSLNRPFVSFLPREYHGTFADHLRRVIETGVRQTTEIRITAGDGTPIWTRFESRRHTGFADEALCLTVAVDISDYKRITDDLILVRENAVAANNAKSAFLANMSHEMRTPLSGIISMSELAMQTHLSEEQQGYIAVIHSSARSLLSIADDVLDVGRVEADQVQLEKKPFRLRDLILSVEALFGPSARQKMIELRTNIPDTVSNTLMGDRNRIRQILVNLVSNAIKFTDTGAVTISVSEGLLSDFLREITFEVVDTGPGIDREEQRRIYEVFRRTVELETQPIEGERLGLAISRKLSRLMGGQLYFETAPGGGTRFLLSIPLELAPTDETGETENVDESGIDLRPGMRGRILVAEDNTLNILVIRTVLEKSGYEVTAVQNGHEAITMLEQTPFDLVLMDISMPGMDGITATREIRRRHGTNGFAGDIPVIAISAHSMKGDRERFLQAGMNDYISKPFVRDTIIKVIERNLRKER